MKVAREEDTIVDEAALLDAMGGDWETVHAVVRTFTRALKAYRLELSETVARGEPKAIREVAHKLKGTLANLRAPSARAFAEALELAAQEGRTQEFAALGASLLSSMGAVERVLSTERFLGSDA
ncbi:MAG: Hpt domain-containing protein [Myxococcales bacterium]|nr:Hpt domain-containing protein [Myxococcales bacterium]